MSQIIAKLQAFVAQPEVDQMTPIWSISQDDARAILAEIAHLQSLAGKVDLLQTIGFGDIKQAARRNGADATQREVSESARE